MINTPQIPLNDTPTLFPKGKQLLSPYALKLPLKAILMLPNLLFCNCTVRFPMCEGDGPGLVQNNPV